MKNNIDIEAILFMRILNLKEEKNKEYSSLECDNNIAYIFNDYNEYKDYFIKNDFDTINDELLKLCKMKTTKKGSVIALKGLCDHTIARHNMLINNRIHNSYNLSKKRVS